MNLSVVNSVLGGSMSSRLFQRIREESGLAYSIYSYPNSYTDCGLMTVYAAARPDSLKQGGGYDAQRGARAGGKGHDPRRV